eukprot:7629112-Alexandrium_andersonii.AAC.1
MPPHRLEALERAAPGKTARWFQEAERRKQRQLHPANFETEQAVAQSRRAFRGPASLRVLR